MLGKQVTNFNQPKAPQIEVENLDPKVKRKEELLEMDEFKKYKIMLRMQPLISIRNRLKQDPAALDAGITESDLDLFKT